MSATGRSRISYKNTHYDGRYSLTTNRSYVNYYGDEYSEDEYTDEDDLGSEYRNPATSTNTRTPPRYDYGRRAVSVPVSTTRASQRETSTTNSRRQRAATCEPRLLFAPSRGAKSSVAKGKEFEDYFKEGVERVRRNITAKIEFQKKLDITPGCGDKRRFCKPDAVFTKGKKGAIVEMKNYEGTRLGRAQVDKTYKDMCALKDAMKCSQVAGYIYVRHQTKVDSSVVDHARQSGISIVREGEVDADELAELVDRNLKI